GGILAAAEGLPGGAGELQAAVVAVAGVDRPVAAGLALGQAVPHRAVGDRRCGSTGVAGALGAARGLARAGALGRVGVRAFGVGAVGIRAVGVRAVGVGAVRVRTLGIGAAGVGGLGGRLRLGLRLRLGGRLGALDDDLVHGLGDDLFGDQLGLGDLTVDDRLGVDLLDLALLALGGGLGPALEQRVVLLGGGLEGD